MSAARDEFADYVVELMSGWGPVTAKRMFGGHGLYRDGLMFALIADEQLYFKVDDENRAAFEQADSRPFEYVMRGKPMRMSYWLAPDGCLESPPEMAEWSRSGFAAALRAQHKETSRKRKKPACD
jgi:DNA transformation protein